MIESTEPMSLPRREMQQVYFGTPAAPGVVVGRLYSPSSDVYLSAVPDRASADVDLDTSDFQDALSAVRAELRGGGGEGGESVPEDLMALYQVYEMILGDPNLVDTVIARIRSGQWAPAAVRDTTRELTARFEAMDDAYLRAGPRTFAASGGASCITCNGKRIPRRTSPSERCSSGKALV